MRYWQQSNSELAEQQAFSTTIGYLQQMGKTHKEINIEALLAFMENQAQENFNRLNRQHPEYREL